MNVIRRRWWATPLTFDGLVAVLLFTAIMLAASLMPAQSDTWWQLRAGEQIWRTGVLPYTDQFSYTVHGGYWPNHEWLSELTFYAIYSAGGMRLLTGVGALLVVSTWLIVWRLTPGTWLFRLTLLVAALIPSSLAWSLRPQLFSLFFFSVLLWLLVRAHYAVLPLLFLVWANMHGGVVVGIVILIASLAAAFAAGRPSRAFVIASALSVGATVMTPLGLSLWAEVPRSLARLREYQVSEWRSPQLGDPALLSFWMLAGALVLLVLFRKSWTASREHRAFELVAAVVPALALLPLALSTSRNVPPFVMLVVPALGRLAQPWGLFARPASERVDRPRLHLGLAVVVMCIAGGAIGHAWTTENSRLRWHPLSADALHALESCPDRIYNRYDEGGYLIWFLPDRKVFIDNRQDPFPVSLMREHLKVEGSGDFRPLFSRYGIRCALVGTASVLSTELRADHWEIKYADAQLSVLTRRETAGKP